MTILRGSWDEKGGAQCPDENGIQSVPGSPSRSARKSTGPVWDGLESLIPSFCPVRDSRLPVAEQVEQEEGPVIPEA